MILDARFIRRRRRDLSLSQRGLAREIGVKPRVISVLESGGNHPFLTLRFLVDLATALAVPVQALFISEEEDPLTTPLATEVGALLMHAGTLVEVDDLAEALDEQLDAVEDALKNLDLVLRPAGLTVHRLSRRVAIRAAGTVDRNKLKRLLRRRHARYGMNIIEARVLAAVAAGTFDESRMSNPAGVAFSRLQNSGLVTEHGTNVSDDVREALDVSTQSGVRGTARASDA